MTIRSIAKNSMFLFVCFSLQTQGTQFEPGEKTQYDFTKRAREVLPDQPTRFSLQQIEQVFHPLLDPQIKDKFDAYFQVLFDAEFPLPFHPDAFINGGYRCLLSKILAANTHTQIEKLRELQLMAIYETMVFHRKSIAKIRGGKYRALADEIPELAICRDCVKEATLEVSQSS